MRQLFAIVKNTFLQTVRQPIYGIIVLVTLGGLMLAPSVTGFTLDDDDKMLRDIGLSTLLLQGLFLACFAASSGINTEIEDKTVLTSAAKPVGRFVFILGKYVGVLAAVGAAQYLAGIAFFMVMRHGVLQTAADSSDMTVIVFGPFALIAILLAATAFNYVFDWRFLPTVISLAVPVGTLGVCILLAVDRNWKVQSYEVKQTMDNLPPEINDPALFKGIIEFRPLEGQGMIAGNHGHLVRSVWKGPINDEDRAYLMGLAEMPQWKKDVNFLVIETRKKQGPDMFKAGVLVFAAISVLTSVAVAISTRLGMVATYVGGILVACLGLTSDYYLMPFTQSARTDWLATLAKWVYPLVPNFQVFWMIDALSEDRIIPWGYIVNAYGYAVLCSLAFVALAAALFETREVG